MWLNIWKKFFNMNWRGIELELYNEAIESIKNTNKKLINELDKLINDYKNNNRRGGEKPFTLVEETATVSEELETINMYGEPELLIDTVGALSNNAVTWISDGVSFYATSEVMDEDQLLKIQGSILDRDTIGYITGADVRYYDENGEEIDNIFLLNRKLR